LVHEDHGLRGGEREVIVSGKSPWVRLPAIVNAGVREDARNPLVVLYHAEDRVISVTGALEIEEGELKNGDALFETEFSQIPGEAIKRFGMERGVSLALVARSATGEILGFGVVALRPSGQAQAYNVPLKESDLDLRGQYWVINCRVVLG
jgi:hypothetical protein